MMKTKAKPRSRILAAVHEAAQDAFDAGVMDKRTMRHFDEMCLTAVEQLTADQIRALRERAGVSQAIFARHLNVTTNLVSKWERGEKRPGGPALKLLSIIKAKGLEGIA
jgi:putative transcriptional regulator